MITDSATTPTHTPTPRAALSLRAGLVVGALGVVFGDIGTSPIYTLQTVFNPAGPYPVPINVNNVYGVVSLIFWSVMIIVTLTYVTLIMRADNDGEGGVMALITLVRRLGDKSGGRLTGILATLGILGAALFFGDSMITPAISVLSAVEGLKVVDPQLHDFVIPVTVAIIVGLFGVQRHGTAIVGRFFGPVMIVWFLVIGICGVRGITGHPQILRALSPVYAIEFVAGHFHIAFFALAAIVLAVTGAEALYADMGHFGRPPITVAWLGLVLPALVLNYFGQGALLLGDESLVTAPFFMLVPNWAQIPMILLATAATIIASQAVITGAYSVATQAARLGYLPRLRVAHTSESSIGQVYVPWINGVLLVGVLILVLAFRSSAALAYAYGMAVTGTIAISTLLFLYVAHIRWRVPVWALVIGGGSLLVVDLMFLAANLTKLLHGAWLPLLVGLVIFTLMTTWQRGQQITAVARDKAEGSLVDFIDDIANRQPPLSRTPGTGIFLSRGPTTAPLALRATVHHNRALHSSVIIVTIETPPIPRVPDTERIVHVDDLGDHRDGIFFLSARFGYMERPNVSDALRLVDPSRTEGAVDLDNASYFLSRLDLSAGPDPVMAPWRKRLYIAISHMAADSGYFGIPLDQTVIIGSRIEI